jgi:2-iminobutanoate/2-iminopropanoate deaminase
MEIDYIHSEEAPIAFGPYSQATRLGDLIFCSGQAAIDPATGKLVEGGIKEQTRQVFRNLDAVLRAAGSDLSRVMKTSVFIHDWQDFPGVNEVFGEVFGDKGPARSTIRGERWPEGSLVAIEAIAVAKSDQ